VAITQISRIQHRHGYHENLPQLATAELGWCLDTKQLFIGNGTVEEGAPNLGNTEILTEFSDIFALRGTYSYKGERGTYTVQTGPTALSPITRTLGDKIDDYVSVRDFGAFGDGITDDTAAINRGIANLYKPNLIASQPLVRRTLFFPAGRYVISGIIDLFPFVTIRGEGKDATIILQTSASATAVMRNVDSNGNVGLNNGINGATPSQYNEVTDLTLMNMNERDILQVDSLNSILLRRVAFVGPRALPTIPGSAVAGVRIKSSAFTTKNVIIDECVFSKLGYGTLVEDSSKSITVNKSTFTELYQGVRIVHGSHISVTQSFFDSVAAQGIICLGSTSSAVSSYNYFADVGNTQSGTTPSTAAVEFENGNCFSIADGFARTAANEDVMASIDLHRQQSASLGINGSLTQGTNTQYAGKEVVLVDNALSLAYIETPKFAQNAVFNYTITRGTSSRIGTLKVTKVGTTIVYDDEYTENSTVGVTLVPVEDSGNISLNYTSTLTNEAPIFNYTLHVLK
jgi:hypothetical protein